MGRLWFLNSACQIIHWLPIPQTDHFFFFNSELALALGSCGAITLAEFSMETDPKVTFC